MYIYIKDINRGKFLYRVMKPYVDDVHNIYYNLTYSIDPHEYLNKT